MSILGASDSPPCGPILNYLENGDYFERHSLQEFSENVVVLHRLRSLHKGSSFRSFNPVLDISNGNAFHFDGTQ